MGAASSVDSAAVQESIAELLGYVNQAEDFIAQIWEEDLALSDSKDVKALESTELRVGMSQKTISQLTELKTQAEGVSCGDPAFAAAAAEYFSLRLNSESSLLNIRVFLQDYYTLFSMIAEKPMESDYTSMENFYNDLYSWYQAVKEGYDAITSCPSNLEPQWKKYGEILDLNEDISLKLYKGNSYQDHLRSVSALNLSNRFYIVEPVLFEELQSGWQDETSFADEQSSYAAALAEELRAYAEMDGEARSSYVFQNIYTNEFLYSCQAIDTIYPSLYNTYNAFLVLRMGCVSGSRDVLVEAEIEGLTQKYKERIHLNTTDQAIYIKPPALTGELDLSSAKSAQISLTISDMNGDLIEAKTFPVTIKSKYDFEWYSNEYGVATQDNILCFLTPESEAISRLKRQAIEEISHMTGGQMNSFVGYQNNAWNNHYVGTYLQAAGLMRAMYEMGVRYNMDPFSLSGSNQHILLPDDVLERQSGLCIETSLVIASALKSANMHAFIVLPPGHAQVAVEIWNGRGESTAGTGQYFLIETTSLSSDLTNVFIDGANSLLDNVPPKTGPITYMNREQWKQYLAVEGTYLIDCDDANIMGLTPFAN